MYEYIRGQYQGINKDYIVIENNGIGYKIYSSGSTMASMPQIGENIILYIIQIVRQDFIGLYGFSSKDELELFNKLLTVNGVGAKAALSLLSISNVDTLKKTIVLGEDKMITKAPGIGKKIAQRIILELKDKIELPQGAEENMLEEVTNKEDIKIIREAKEALVSLGYSEKESEKALKNIENKNNIEDIIKDCLKFLMN
ncbi:Holliday junction branch migration protein RuvA [Hathewaya limosa]|uniref:Holliday junction branch migration complex subunit RuvA n=1 Tax=Hathewaya limosa TaxID=1536 RepID=A0ABU0JRE7_HATLI|nr:Holliday junction branch migration protein RuvA [Hathewaya limosa]MDQ0479673.1 Holliday junction DNA helicase RuvA [Hathewaya limosa]